jgi:hypothetical protein
MKKELCSKICNGYKHIRTEKLEGYNETKNLWTRADNNPKMKKFFITFSVEGKVVYPPCGLGFTNLKDCEEKFNSL